MKKYNFLQTLPTVGIWVLMLTVLIGLMNLPAQDVTKVGTSAAPFLRIPVGSRGTAMGGAFVSVVDDPSAMFWNPGGLPRIPQYSLMVDYSSWLPGLDFNYMGLVLPTRRLGTVGFNVTALTTEEMEITTPSQPMGTGETFTATSIAVGISYGRNLTDRFSIGATVKYITEKILNSQATGLGFDIGTIYNTPFSGIRLGFSIANFGTKLQMTGEDLNVRVDIAPDQEGNNESTVGQLKTDEFDMPLIMRVGLSWDIWTNANQRFTIALDGLNPNDNSQSVNVGGEYALFNEVIVLRGGFNDMFLEDREKGLTLGTGVNVKMQGNLGFSAEYAYQDFKHLGGVNRFTARIRF